MMQAWEATSMVSLLSMISLATPGYSFSMIKAKWSISSKLFAKRAQTKYEVSLKHIRSDNGTKFKNTHIEDFLDAYGFTHEFSAAYTPQQNGVVERKNRTMLAEYKTLIRFWAEAINTACHIINKVYLHKFLK